MQDAIAVQSLKQTLLYYVSMFSASIFGACRRAANLLWFARRSLSLLPTMERFNRKGTRAFQPFMEDELPDAIHLPSHLNLPLFFFMWTVFGLIKHAQKNRKLSVVWRVLLKNVGSLKQIRYLPCKNGCRVTTQQR